MFVFSRRSVWPQLYRVSNAVACCHDDGVTLLPLPADQESGWSIEALSGGGYGVILRVGEHSAQPRVVAQYPTRRLARRQLRRLAGDAGWGWPGWLGRALLIAGLLFLMWFLFFVPGDLSALSVRLPPGGPAETALKDSTATARAVDPRLPSNGPAFIDDPAKPAPSRGGNVPNANRAGAGPDSVPVR
jgi:hypothetical protein